MIARISGILTLAAALAIVAPTPPARGGTTDAEAPPGPTTRTSSVAGMVTAVDRDLGTVSLQTTQGRVVTVTFTPQSVEGVQVGDDIVATLSFTHSVRGAHRQPADRIGLRDPDATMTRQLTGTVTAIDRDRGMIFLQAGDDALALPFSPDAMERVQQGETLRVDLSFARTGSGEESPGAARDPSDVYARVSEPGPQPEPARRAVIRATVAEVDRVTGLVTAQPADLQQRPLVLQFPPAAVEALKPGEEIVARMTYALGPPSDPIVAAGDAPAPSEADGLRLPELEAELGQMTATGTVQALDRASGRLELKTDQATLKLQFAPAAVKDLQEGEQITVDMGFARL